jgi:hypothetical protein
MTPAREALTLPLLFLSIVLVGGLHLTDAVQVRPPTLFSLVLAALLVGVIVQSGTLAPARLMHASRDSLANANGFVVFVTLFGATAQILSLLSPETGVPSTVFSLFLLVVVLQLMAASLDRTRLLRVLAVTCAAAFTFKFIVLAALSAPAAGPVGRAVQALFDGVTLGAVSQPVLSPAAGYVAFGTITLYLTGLVLLPHAGWTNVRSLPSATVDERARSRLGGSGPGASSAS